jgi:hypothetical protein
VSYVRRPRRKRRSVGRRVALAVALAVAFVAGIGLGAVLHDSPSADGSQTIVRTLRPLPVTPVPTETITVTTSNR